MAKESNKNQKEYYIIKYAIGQNIIEKIMFANGAQEIRSFVSLEKGSLMSIKKRQQRWWEKEVVSYAYKSAFLSSIKFYVDSGMSPTAALKQVIEGEHNPNLYIELNVALSIIKNGGSFVDALRSMGFLDNVIVSILDSGERSSNMDAAIEMSEDYMIERVENRKKLVSIFTYLSLELGSAYSGFLYLKFEMIPQFISELLPKIKSETLKASAESSIFWINGLNNFFIFGFAGIALVVASIMFYFRYFSNGAETSVSKIPMISRYVELVDYAVSFTLLSFMLKSGVVINNALSICRDAVTSPAVINGLTGIIYRVENGKKIQDAMAGGDFDSSEKVVLNAHQNIDQLSTILGAIGKKRKEMSVKMYKKISRLGVIVLVVLSLVVVVEMAYLLSVQSEITDGIMNL